jgi:ATP phosphoribosyltransferase
MSVLKIAIQKSGRLSENSKKLLEECGIKFSSGISVLKTSASNFPVEVLFLRDDDIPQYVEQQVADIGILGENMVFEKNKDVDIIEKLGFATCRLSLAIPKEEKYTGPGYFNNKKVATSYPKMLTDFFKKNNITAEIEEINAKENKYILLNAPDSAIEKICSILPGMKSPSIIPLVNKGWCSIHSVVKEDQFWDRIDQLKEAGAEGILVIPIEKMIL